MENQPKDFDRWNESKKKIDIKKRPIIKVGKIYWCNLGLNVGVEQNGRGDNFQRPVIIIKKFSHQIVLIAPLTSKIHNGDWYKNIEIHNKKLQVILNQIKPIDTKRLLKELGEISEKKVYEILEDYLKLLLTNK